MTLQPLAEPIALNERYTLLGRLAIGGMAEIYLARQAAMAGFEKEVVIKRLKPEMARDPRLVAMFLDEARICAMLGHPNVVHVYDVDLAGDTPFVAMEYIRGEDLSALCRRGLRLKQFLPLAHAIHLIHQAATGLGYVHARRSAAGEPLSIVHCDISPSNLLITEEGYVKIIDFGIARAKNQSYRDEHVIPGKLSYMSPEQAERAPLDHRSDIFSLGIMLYEITVGKRLFKGPAAEVMARLRAGDIRPPTFVRRDYPGSLEAIVMRTLERHPADRYASAYDLADALEEFMREASLHSGPVRIARYVNDLTMAGGGKGRPELLVASERDDADELDFDRRLFDGFVPAPERRVGRSDTESEWDDYEEADAAVAAALGMELESYQRARTPVPLFASMKAAVQAKTPLLVPSRPKK